MTFDNDHNGRLGPHEFKEAELMLAGKKAVAFFYADYPDEYLHDIKKYIENVSLNHSKWRRITG